MGTSLDRVCRCPARAARSRDRSEWIFDANARDYLLMIEILGEQPRGSGLGRGGDNESVPKSNLRFVFNAEGGSNFGGRGFHAPDRVAVYHQPCCVFRKR